MHTYTLIYHIKYHEKIEKISFESKMYPRETRKTAVHKPEMLRKDRKEIGSYLRKTKWKESSS